MNIQREFRVPGRCAIWAGQAAIVAAAMGCGSDSSGGSNDQQSYVDLKATIQRIDAAWAAKKSECKCTQQGLQSCSSSSANAAEKLPQATACADALETMSCDAFKAHEYDAPCAGGPCTFNVTISCTTPVAPTPLGGSCVSSCGGTCPGTYLDVGSKVWLITASGNNCDDVCISSAGIGGTCSGHCSTDAECSNATRPMRCLTACQSDSAAAGRCWAEEGLDEVVAAVCKSGGDGGV
jgi:hypothetical protein